MFDTNVTIIGNALNTPEWRRVDGGKVLVSNFKVATTSRRYDRATDRWVDGASLRVRVNCWRKLAENVSGCVLVGDPVIVTGRLYSREWEGEDKVRRVSYELDAYAVGHDLARGRGKFSRQRASMSTTTIEDDETEARVAGERTSPVPEMNDRQVRRVWDDELGGYVNAPVAAGAEIGSGFSAPEFGAMHQAGRYRSGRTGGDEIDFATFAGTGAVGERRDEDGDPELDDDLEEADDLAGRLESVVARAQEDDENAGSDPTHGSAAGSDATAGPAAGSAGDGGDHTGGDGSVDSAGDSSVDSTGDSSDDSGDGDALASRRRKRGRVVIPA